MTEKILIVLVSNGVSDRSQRSEQDRAMTMLDSQNVPFLTIDGMDPAQRDRRNSLFEISGIRRYPQFFFQHADGSTVFMGNYEKLEGLNETRTMSQQVIDAYPDLETWKDVFDGVVDPRCPLAWMKKD